MDFQTKGLGLGEVGLADVHIHGSLSQSQPNVPRVERGSWFSFGGTPDDAPDFVVRESVRGVGNIEDATDPRPNLA